MIRLFTSIYPEKDLSRRAELLECLQRNQKCVGIDQICVLIEGSVDWFQITPKIITKNINNRPSYDDFFAWISELVKPGDISILSNSDIWFGDQIKFLKEVGMPTGEVWALSRWDVAQHDQVRHYNRKDSQDVWIFQGAPVRVAGAFPLGVPRCDNRIAAEFARAGYRMRNPSFSVQAFHLHASPPRLYEEKEHSVAIPKPYLYVWPENLWCWPRVALYNLRHPQAALSYRFDIRRWSPLRPLRAARFHLGALRRRIFKRASINDH